MTKHTLIGTVKAAFGGVDVIITCEGSCFLEISRGKRNQHGVRGQTDSADILAGDVCTSYDTVAHWSTVSSHNTVFGVHTDSDSE